MKSYFYIILMLFVSNCLAQTKEIDATLNVEKRMKRIEQSGADFIEKFDPYSATLRISKNTSNQEIDALYYKLKTILKQGVFIGIIGYSSDYDTDIENFKLGLKRAKELKEFLVKRYDLNSANINVTSLGNSTKKPIPANCITIRFFDDYITFIDIQDTDNDGVPDRTDKCPTIKGILENDGCPSRKTTIEKHIKVKIKQLLAEAKTIDYTTLPKQIIKDLPLSNLGNTPTFIKTYHIETVCSFEDQIDYKSVLQLQQNFTSQKFFNQKTLQAIQEKIKSPIVLYMQLTGFTSGTYFSANPMMKDYPQFMPTLSNQIIDTLHIHTQKEAFGYLPYKKQRLKNPLVITKAIPDYIQQTNHIYLNFSNKVGKKVSVSGEINTKKIYLNYQYKNEKWHLIDSKTTFLERKKTTQYTVSKKGFTAVYKHKNTYYSIQERLKLYRRKIIADIKKSQSSNKPIHLENVAEISNYDFDKLYDKKFIAYEGDYKYELHQFNKEFFFMEVFHNDSSNTTEKKWTYYSSEVLPFGFIELKDKKKILTLISKTHTNYIIPKRDHLTLKIWARYQRNKIILLNFSETQTYKPKYDSKKLFLISSHLHQLGNYYEIVAEKGKKRLYNYRGEDVLKKSYDSIVLSNFIIGFKGKKQDVYNQTFKKLKLPKLQAVHLDRSNRYNLQVIQNNELKSIPLSNDTSEKHIIMNPRSPYMPQLKAEIAQKIEERANEFAFIHEFAFDTLTIPKNEIKDIYFLQNRKKEIVTDHYAYVITELIDGSFNMFGLRKPNTNLLEHVHEITQVGNCIRFKKDNLYGYYGIHTKVRYKKLDQFQGFYAHFELPNGKQGWLDRNGKEYLNL